MNLVSRSFLLSLTRLIVAAGLLLGAGIPRLSAQAATRPASPGKAQTQAARRPDNAEVQAYAKECASAYDSIHRYSRDRSRLYRPFPVGVVLMLVIGADGKVEDVSYEPKGDYSGDVAWFAKRTRFPAPPRAHYPVKLQFTTSWYRRGNGRSG